MLWRVGWKVAPLLLAQSSARFLVRRRSKVMDSEGVEESLLKVISLQITNSRSVDLALDLEPWGEHLHVPPGVSVLVSARGPKGGMLDVEYGDIGITLWG